MKKEILFVYQDKHNYSALRVAKFPDKESAMKFLEEECPEGDHADCVIIEGFSDYEEESVDKT